MCPYVALFLINKLKVINFCYLAFVECAAGKYKQNVSNDLQCLSCPANSWSIGRANKYCSCVSGYYRTDPYDLSSPCIQYPSEPKNLTVFYLDQTSIKLRWDAVDGYPTDKVQYKVECYKCDTKNNLNFGNAQSFGCLEKLTCESYVKYLPKKEQIFKNK